jgi:hypothetical protein
VKLLLQGLDLPLHLGTVVYSVVRAGTVLGEQGGHQRVGVAHHRDGDTLVDDPLSRSMMAMPCRAGMAASTGRGCGSAAPGGTAAPPPLLPAQAPADAIRPVLADMEPDGVDFAGAADHLGNDVEEEPELPFDG